MTKPNKAPAFQFYVKDWLADKNIRVMTPAERGAYIELMAHEWNESGKLTNCDDELSMLSGLGSDWHGKSGDKIKACFKKKGEKYLYHPRLKKEREKQRDWREKSSEGGKKSAKLRKDKAKSAKGGSRVVQPIGQPKGNTTSTSAFTSTFTSTEELNKHIGKIFEAFWKLYPNKKGKDGAFKKFKKNIIDDTTYQQLILATNNYNKEIKDKKTQLQYIKHGSSFMTDWQDYLEVDIKPTSDINKKDFTEGLNDDGTF